jgi:hypothetical protein
MELTLSARGAHVLAGVVALRLPATWPALPAGLCLDGRVLRLARAPSAVRAVLVYHRDDTFKAARSLAACTFCAQPLADWLRARGLETALLLAEDAPACGGARRAVAAGQPAPFELWDARLFAIPAGGCGCALDAVGGGGCTRCQLSADFLRGYWDAAWARQTGWADAFRAARRVSLRQANALESVAERDNRRAAAFRASSAPLRL